MIILVGMQSILDLQNKKQMNILKDWELPSQELINLKDMYNGYKINGTTLYNPFSIVNFASQSVQLTGNVEKSLRFHIG